MLSTQFVTQYRRSAGHRDLLVTTWTHTYDDIYGEDRVNDITARWHSVQALANGLSRV